MKNLIPEFKSKSELFTFLRANKSKLISQKKSLPTTSDDLEFGYSKVKGTKVFGTKATVTEEPVEGELPVEIVANMSGWCDSQMDVMIKDSWKKSITEVSASGQKISYHLKNHDYTMDAIIGKDPVFSAMDLDLSMFNISSDIKKAQALVCSSTIMEKYDEKIYALYEDGQVRQHSIGLQYIQIVLCLDSTEEEDAQEKKNWDKYYPQVINKEKVDNYGYFWAVIEAKILEVSAVLYGANILTPVLSSGKSGMDMSGAANENKNIEFIDLMIPHHELAIKMVNDYQDKVDDTDLLAIMANIKTSQKAEIDKMAAIKIAQEEKSKNISGSTVIEPFKNTHNQPHKDTNKKSVIGCQDCSYLFVPQPDGTPKCPNCGCYVSPNSTMIMLSDETFDWKKAIEETVFI